MNRLRTAIFTVVYASAMFYRQESASGMSSHLADLCGVEYHIESPAVGSALWYDHSCHRRSRMWASGKASLVGSCGGSRSVCDGDGAAQVSVQVLCKDMRRWRRCAVKSALKGWVAAGCRVIAIIRVDLFCIKMAP